MLRKIVLVVGGAAVVTLPSLSWRPARGDGPSGEGSDRNGMPCGAVQETL